jgi:hypothetical protein
MLQDSRGVASGYAGYALAYPKNWQVNVAVKKKKQSQQRDVYTVGGSNAELARTSGHSRIGARTLQTYSVSAASRSPSLRIILLNYFEFGILLCSGGYRGASAILSYSQYKQLFTGT